MSEQLVVADKFSTEIERNGLHHGATDCTDPSQVARASARGIWKSKTAEHWAAAAGREPRVAKYWLAGGDVPEAGRLAIIKLLA